MKYSTTKQRIAGVLSRVKLPDYIGTDECWEVQLKGKSNPYGCATLPDGKVVGVHRFMYEMSIGPVAPGLFVLHTCDNPTCCNPDHLWLGTKRDNLLDAVKKGRRYQSQKTISEKEMERWLISLCISLLARQQKFLACQEPASDNT